MAYWKLILLPFAVYRLSRLFAYESGPFYLIDKLKVWLYTSKELKKHTHLQKSLDYLFNCPYCLGIWFAAFLVVVKIPYLVEIFGVAGIQSLITTLDRDMEGHIKLTEKENDFLQIQLMGMENNGYQQFN